MLLFLCRRTLTKGSSRTLGGWAYNFGQNWFHKHNKKKQLNVNFLNRNHYDFSYFSDTDAAAGRAAAGAAVVSAAAIVMTTMEMVVKAKAVAEETAEAAVPQAVCQKLHKNISDSPYAPALSKRF